MNTQLGIAIEIALSAHEGQRYGETNFPYAYHLNQVHTVCVARNAPKDMDPGQAFSDLPYMDTLLAVCFLHDVLEDTELTEEDLESMGVMPHVVEALVILDKNRAESYRKYIESCRNHPVAREVKICDTIANLTNSVMSGNSKRIKKYSNQLSMLEREASVLENKARKKTTRSDKFKGYVGEQYNVE